METSGDGSVDHQRTIETGILADRKRWSNGLRRRSTGCSGNKIVAGPSGVGVAGRIQMELEGEDGAAK
ncbi:hypothetical protein L2E82_15300 [Cichorium intybus]|uniref:Uncharacterized protein n=1 Tax=Cichorium intybus TaxID=13427 RepID=A0ACB9F2G0_CICIN|nr:hypothetical protein L2E82_15300 [Cichorium intybus]